MKQLNLPNLSVNISEEDYHEYPSICYSDLSKYVKEGFSCIKHLREHKLTESLLEGSIIDTFITDPANFNNKFSISMTSREKSDKILNILNEFLSMGYKFYSDIPDQVKYDVAVSNNYRAGYKFGTLIKYIDEYALDYNFMSESVGKTIITAEQYDMAVKCKQALYNNVLLKFAIMGNEDIKVYYQLKFFTDVYGVPYKIMPDVIHVDHNNHIVRIYDLKSTRYSALDFPKSYIDYNYWIQQWLYTSILRQIIHTKGFVDYDVVWGGFIVVSKKDYSALLWNFDDINYCSLMKSSDPYINENLNIHWENPFKLGEELYTYQTQECNYPTWINEYDKNDISTYFKEQYKN